MLIHIPAILSSDQVKSVRAALDKAPWIDGRGSAGHMATSAKYNQEADLTDPAVRAQSDFILRVLSSHGRFTATALPARICPPSFNRFSGGQNYGTHNDAALLCFPEASAPRWVRTDLAATLFLAAPEDYDGGELVIEDTFGPVRVKLPAGDILVYPASSQHRVEPVTRGARVGSFIWLQSLVRDDNHRKLLHELDTALMRLNQAMPGSKDVAQLLGLYHNLLRMWSDT
ncbi:MAG TPA: Fe2+-dependent dioxygenase [Rhizomicrobium sp.]|jgi:PKHD-type hydroxylase|nr:Fe2+-dependent dioxygenase [Rhizomicrobium sp.]